ncbi:MAG: hypothetical protein K8R86_13255 [Bacteroidales bacterium]|nr:hypothetical protein [Bacteroidales bacterium]
MKKQSVLSPLSGSIIITFFSILLLGICQSQETIGFVRMQGNNGTLNLPVISEADAIGLGNGVVKIALGNGLNGAAWLVSTTDPDASEVRIQTPYGTKAWKKLVFNLYAKAYGGFDSEIMQDMCLTNEGGIALAGYTQSYGAGNYDDLLLKLAEEGTFEWGNAYGYSGSNSCYAIIQTTDDEYFIGGSTYNGGAGGSDQVYRRLENDGDLIWEFWSGTSGTDACKDVLEDADGNYVTVGYTTGMGNGYYDIWYRKMDKNHNSIWGYTYGNTAYDAGEAIIRNAAGGYALCGITQSYGNGGEEMIFLILDSSGSAIDLETFGGVERDGAYDLCLTSDGGYVLAGYTASFGNGSDDWYVLKLDNAGEVIWSYAYGGTEFDRAESVIETSDLGYAILGKTQSFGAGSNDLWLIKVDANGQIIWFTLVGGLDSDGGKTIRQGSDDCLYAAGYTNSLGAGELDFMLIKFSPDGSTCVTSKSGAKDSQLFVDLPEDIIFTRRTNGSEIATPVFQDSKTILSKEDVMAEINVKSAVIQSDDVTPVTPTVTTICD